MYWRCLPLNEMGELGSCVLTMRTALWEEEEKCAKCINSQWWILSFECFTFILEFHCLSRHQRGKKYIGSKINCSSSGNVQPHKSPYGDPWWGEVLVSLSRPERDVIYDVTCRSTSRHVVQPQEPGVGYESVCSVVALLWGMATLMWEKGNK